jgi:hypothetical protein
MSTTDPDAALMTRYCDEVLYPMLTEGCYVDAALASAISADVLKRARSFVVLPDSVRDVLMTPFIEEVFDHDPPEGTLEMKAAVTVVVRNSLLEDAHANGPSKQAESRPSPPQHARRSRTCSRPADAVTSTPTQTTCSPTCPPHIPGHGQHSPRSRTPSAPAAAAPTRSPTHPHHSYLNQMSWSTRRPQPVTGESRS